MDLRDYLLLGARNWLVLAVAAGVGLVTAGVLILVATPQYEARAQVLFSARNAGDGQDLAYAGNYVQSRIQTYKDLATSRVVLAGVIEARDLDESVDGLAERVEVEVSQIDTVVTVVVSDPDAGEAASTANAVAEALLGAVAEIDGSSSADAPSVEGRMVSPAEEPADPADPDKPLYLLAGLLGGLFVGAAVVGVRHVVQPEPELVAAAT